MPLLALCPSDRATRGTAATLGHASAFPAARIGNGEESCIGGADRSVFASTLLIDENWHFHDVLDCRDGQVRGNENVVRFVLLLENDSKELVVACLYV